MRFSLLISVWLLFLTACGARLGAVDAELNAPSAAADDALACTTNTEGTCIVSTDACNPQNVFSGDDNTTCSACQGEDGEELICGEVTEAQCFDLESPSGGSCQRCITIDGDVLYDDCSEEFVYAAHTCEEVQRAHEDALRVGMLTCDNDTECADGQSCFFQSEPEDGVCVDNGDLMLCTVCRDGDGHVLEESCRPQIDSCSQNVDEQGRDCIECFRDGQSIWRECSTPDLEPDRCEEYSNQDGRCVDCYGAAGEMLSHQCTLSASAAQAVGGEAAPTEGEDGVVSATDPAPGPTEFCDSYPLPGGITCSACYDEDGNLLSETCAESEPDLRCEELRFSEQTCTVCVDALGNAHFTECTRNDCENQDDICAPAPACEVQVSGDSGYCRVCPVGSNGESETRCLVGGDLTCRFEDDFDNNVTEIGPDDPAAAPTFRVCTVCSADHNEVYRNCGDNVEAPLCLRYSESEGECEVCFDTETQAEIYSTCSWSLSPFQLDAGAEGTCSPLEAQTLTEADGTPVWAPNGAPGEEPPIAVDCTSCTLEAGPPDAGTFSACRVRAGHCEEATSHGPAPVICTAQIQTYQYTMTDCVRPWGNHAADAGVRQMIAWLSQTHGVTVWNGSFLEHAADPYCPNGGRFQVEAAIRSGDILQAIGFTVTP